MDGLPLRRAADSIGPSPLPAQRNSRGEGRVRGGKFLSAARLNTRCAYPPRGLGATLLFVLLFVSNPAFAQPGTDAGADTPRQTPAPDGPFSIPAPTLGGSQFWSDELIYHDWRIQRNAVTNHCRLLDEKDVRRAWGTFEQCQASFESLKREQGLPPLSGRVVLVLHGLGRSRKSMNPLCRYLKKHPDLTVMNVSYATTRRTLQQHAQSLARVIENLGDDVREINFVAHSLGNIVVRQYLHDHTAGEPAKRLDPRIRRMVMLGPPNQGARFATWFKDQAMARWLVGSVLTDLANDANQLSAPLAVPNFQFGIVAGGRKDGEGLNDLLPGDDDFVVSVEEAKLPGARDFAIVPVYHGIIMNDTHVQRMTLLFLDRGYFRSERLRQPLPAATETAP